MSSVKSLLAIIYFAFFISLLTKNAGIFMVLKKGEGLNQLGDFLVDSPVVKLIKSMPQQNHSSINPVAVVQKYVGINSAYAYFSPNISEFCELTFTSPDDKSFSLEFKRFLPSVEGRVKLGTIAVFLSSPELYSVRKELFSAVALRVFEENPRLRTLTCSINVIPYKAKRADMVLNDKPQSKQVGFITFTRDVAKAPEASVTSIN
jgi:hypothetical protein